MNCSFFSYELPSGRIAQRPCYPYHAAKLLVVDRLTAELHDSTFFEIESFLNPADLLVFNSSKVIKARLFGKTTNLETKLEVLLLEEFSSNLEQIWLATGKPLKKFKPGATIVFSSELEGQVVERVGAREVLFKFKYEKSEFRARLQKHACMPIPPYIRGGVGDHKDEVDYQPIFAENEGSIAAPTASLHFTPEVLEKLDRKNIARHSVTLHVGRASFSTVIDTTEKGSQLEPPGAERYVYDQLVLDNIKQTRAKGARSIAVGTTVVRALESMIIAGDQEQETELFIVPGFEFQAIDALVTNFHQPGTTHLLLLEAILGRELLEKSYRHALENDYRFLSYGDGMLIL